MQVMNINFPSQHHFTTISGPCFINQMDHFKNFKYGNISTRTKFCRMSSFFKLLLIKCKDTFANKNSFYTFTCAYYFEMSITSDSHF